MISLRSFQAYLVVRLRARFDALQLLESKKTHFRLLKSDCDLFVISGTLYHLN